MTVRGELTPEERTSWIAKTASRKATEVTLAVAQLRDWAKRRTVVDADLIDVLRALDRCAADPRPTVQQRGAEALRTVASAARHAGRLEGLWSAATAAGLARAAETLRPPCEQSADTLDGAVLRHLARGEGSALRTRLVASPDRAREGAGALHREASRGDVGAPVVVAAVADLIVHEDVVVRFAAIDAVAIAGARGECDLGELVPSLIRALDEQGMPPTAPASGTWQTGGIAWSAQRALGHAIRWPASNEAALSALQPLLDGRTKQRAHAAAFAIAWGSARRDDWATVDALLGSAKSHVRAGALDGLVPRDIDRPDAPEVPPSLADRIGTLRRDPDPAVVTAAAQIRVAGGQGGTVDPRILAAGLRSDVSADRQRALALLAPFAGDPDAIAAITPWLIDAIGTEDRWHVLTFVARCERLDATRWATLLAGVLLDGDFTFARGVAATLLARCDAGTRPWYAAVDRDLLEPERR